ncbi:MAG: transglycosylase domain-containing protein [Deferribacteraceae bacterium]|jgi:penicillin-binding protein 1A|nr:transglycosylase domain-containing protein [Deferribacteraceae bacterium]
MKKFRIIAVFFLFLWLTAALFLGLSGWMLTEASMIKLNVPHLTGLGKYSESTRLEIYTADNTLMYRKNFSYGGRLSKEDDLTLAGQIIELARAETEEIPFWERAFLRMERINPAGLKGFVAEYYAMNLTKMSKLQGIKKEILRLYTIKRLSGKYNSKELYALFLDSVYYSEIIHGIKGACEAYFGKEFKDLTPLETAWLIALVTVPKKEPEENIPYHDKVARNYLHELYMQGTLTHEEYRNEVAARLEFKEREYPVTEPSYVDLVLKKLQQYPQLKPTEQNLRIYTHYNKRATDAARKALAPVFARDQKIQGAFVMINIETGGLETAVGSRLPDSEYNRALTLRRQMGSTFKPIVYLTAFKHGYLPSEMVWDKPYTFGGGGVSYRPRNYKNVFMGYIPMRYGLVYSLNNATVNLAQRVGLNRVHKTSVDMGFSATISPYYAMALGSFATTPLNVAELFATLGNYGVRQEITSVNEIHGCGDITLKNPPVNVVDAVSAYQTMYIMQDIPVRGTARGAHLLKGTAAKTGTSDYSRDLWTVAICYPYVIVVWLGYDDFGHMDDDLSGGNTAAPVIAAFQREYFGAGHSFSLNVPPGVEFAAVKKNTGLLTKKSGYDTYIEAFNEDNLPMPEEETKSLKPVKR